MLRRKRSTGGPASVVGTPGRPTLHELDRRIHRVLEVATELFVLNGYSGTSLTDVAKAASVGTRTIYQHLGDKEALFREVILARDSIDAVAFPELRSGDTLFAAMHSAARYMFDFSLRPRSVDLMRLMIAESRRFPDLLSSVGNAAFAQFCRHLSGRFAALADAGVIPGGDDDARARLYIDVILGTSLIMNYAGWTETAPSDVQVRDRIDFFLRGVFGAAIADAARTMPITVERDA